MTSNLTNFLFMAPQLLSVLSEWAGNIHLFSSYP